MTAIRSLIAIAAAAAAVTALPVQAQDTGNFIVRARAVHLDSANKDGVTVPVVGKLGLTINDKTIPEVDVTYFFTPNLAAELILTYPQKQKIYSDGDQIGTFKHLPPTLTLQYHFTGLNGFRPYVGAGVNYTNISAVHFDPAVEAALANALGASKVQLGLKHNSWGLAAQVGVDVPLGGGWLLNVDVKKVQIGTTVYANGDSVGKFKVDPLLVGIGFGKRF